MATVATKRPPKRKPTPIKKEIIDAEIIEDDDDEIDDEIEEDDEDGNEKRASILVNNGNRHRGRNDTNSYGSDDDEIEDSDDSFSPISQRKLVDEKAKQLRDRCKLPTVPSKTPSFNQALEYMKLLTPDMWEQILVYVYRIYPRINRKAKDPEAKKYIDKLSNYFTESDIIKRHGGGQYSLQFNAPQQGGSIMRVELDIDMNQHEPIIPIEEIDVNYSKNKVYVDNLIARGLLTITNEGKPMAVQPIDKNASANEAAVRELADIAKGAIRDKNNAPGIDTMVAKAVDAALSANDKIMARAMQQQDPNYLMNLMKGVQEFTRGNNPQPTGGFGGDIAVIVQMMQTQNQMQMEFMKTLMQNQLESNKLQLEVMSKSLEKKEDDGEKGDEFSKMERILEFTKLIKGGGSNSGPSGEWWERLLQGLAPIVAPIAAPLVGMALNGGFNRQQQPIGANMGVPPIGNVPPQLNAPNPSNVVQMPAVTDALTNPEPQTPEDMMKFALKQSLQQYGNLILNFVAEGKSGFDFADAMVNLTNIAQWRMAANHGHEELLGIIKSIPELWQHLMSITREDKFHQWVKEFCDYEETLAKMEAEEENEEGSK